MDRPTITTIDGTQHIMRDLRGRDWRLLGEFADDAPSYTDADFLEKHAAFVTKFFDGVTTDDILDLPIEDIFPASIAVRNFITAQIGAKLEAIEKNSVADKAP